MSIGVGGEHHKRNDLEERGASKVCENGVGGGWRFYVYGPPRFHFRKKKKKEFTSQPAESCVFKRVK